MGFFSDDDSGGLGGLGGNLNNFLTNPLLLASLQMMSNNTPRVGQPVDTLHGVPQLLFTSATKAKEESDKSKAEKDLQKLFGQLNSSAKITEPPKPIPPPQADNPQSAAPTDGSLGFGLPTQQETPQGTSAPSTSSSVSGLPTPAQPSYGDTAINAMDLGKPAERPVQPAPAEPPLSWLNLPESVKIGLGIKPQAPAQPPTAPDNLEQRIAESAQRLVDQPQPSPQTVTDRARVAYEQNRASASPTEVAVQRGTPAAEAQPAPQIGTPQNARAVPAIQQQPAPPAEPPAPTATERAAAVYAQNRAQQPPTASDAQPPSRALAQSAPPVAQRIDPALYARVMASKHTPSEIKAQLLKQANPDYSFHTQPDGTIVRMNPKTGVAEPVYEGGTKPVWGTIRQGIDGPVMGYLPTPAEYKANEANRAAGAAASDNTIAGVTSKIQTLQEKGASQEEIIKGAVPAHLQGYMKALLRGDAAPAGLGRMQGQVRANLMELAHTIDPNFNEGQIALRQAWAKGENSTSPNSYGSQIRASGTLVNHIGDGTKALDILEKGPQSGAGAITGGYGEYAILNQARGPVNRNSGDSKFNEAAGEYKSAIKGAAGEAERVLSGSHGAEGSKEYWLKALDPAQNPISEVKGAWKQLYNLMYGRLTELAKQKSQAYGTEVDPTDLLDKGQRALASKLGGHPYGTEGEAAPSPTVPAPRDREVDKVYETPKGKARWLGNGWELIGK